jgi:hypothetical protein
LGVFAVKLELSPLHIVALAGSVPVQLKGVETHVPAEKVNPELQVNSHLVAVQAPTSDLGVFAVKLELSPLHIVALAGLVPVQV